MKTPIFIEMNDIHLRGDNVEKIKDLISQACSLGDHLKCKQLLVLGDIFDARPAQKQGVLVAFSEILDYIYSKGFKMLCIAGNHDKSDYTANESYLTQYKDHPAIILLSEPTYIHSGDFYENCDCQFNSYFIPFYEEKVFKEKYDKLISNNPISNKSILFSHIAVTGSRNNDGTIIESPIKPSIFKDFYKVMLGHYHNEQQIGGNIFHLPSICQSNYGEDENKGFTIIFADGSHEFKKSKFKEFKTIKLDVANLSKEAIREIISESNSNTRIELVGEKDILDSVDTTILRDAGIKVVKKNIDLEIEEIEQISEIKKYNKESISKEFTDWCNKEGYNSTEALIYL